MPPGTGDIMLNLNLHLDNLESILVTTSNKDASHVAVRSGELAQELGFNVIGVVENMSYYEHNNEKLYIFGEGGGKEVAEILGVELLIQLPISNQLEEEYNILAKELDERN
jgi:ATP-binding protein involved in chromosome partitioning